MNKYFSLTDKVFDVTEKYPILIEVFAANGFENLRNENLRKMLGKTISVADALKMRKIDAAEFEKQMIAAIENKNDDILNGLSRAETHISGADVTMAGILLPGVGHGCLLVSSAEH